MFNDIIHKLFNTYVSPLQLLAIVIGIVLCAGVLFLMLAYVGSCYDEKNIKSRVIIKSLIAAIAPLLSEFSYLVEKPISDKLILIIFAITMIAVLLWNILTIGVIKGVIFSVVNLGVALIISISIFTVIVFAIIGIGSWLFGGGSTEQTDGSSNSSSKPVITTDYNTASSPEYSANDNNSSNWVWGNDGIRSAGKRINNVSGNIYADCDGNYLTLTEDGKYYVDSDGKYHRVYHDVDD